MLHGGGSGVQFMGRTHTEYTCNGVWPSSPELTTGDVKSKL